MDFQIQMQCHEAILARLERCYAEKTSHFTMSESSFHAYVFQEASSSALEPRARWCSILPHVLAAHKLTGSCSQLVMRSMLNAR